jgi:hypothetical protein
MKALESHVMLLENELLKSGRIFMRSTGKGRHNRNWIKREEN